MGGGGDYSGGLRDSEELEGLFRDRLKSLYDEKKCNLFIPHAWDYDEEYQRLVQLLENVEGFEFQDFSVPKEKPIDVKSTKELEEALERKINRCSVVIIPAGMYAAHREWIQKEISIAKAQGKPIIAVQPWGSEKTPRIVQENADSIVGWNKESIVSEVHRLRRKK